MITKFIETVVEKKLEVNRYKEELLHESIMHFESLCNSEEQLKFILKYLIEKDLGEDFLLYAEESNLDHEDFLYFDELMSKI
jgi:hypothetical protein